MANQFGLEEIAAILAMLRENDVTEFRLEREGEKLALKRGSLEQPPVINVSSPPMNAGGYATQMAPMMAPQLGTESGMPGGYAMPNGSAAQPIAASAEPSKKFLEVQSPMVGTFYRRPAPDAGPYVEVGDMVKKGQVLCIVEAMKLMNEIESEHSGRVVEVCLDDGQMSEFGEVLFRLEPVS